MTKTEKIKEVKILAEKLQRLTGKKVVLKEAQEICTIFIHEEDDWDGEQVGEGRYSFQRGNIEKIKKQFYKASQLDYEDETGLSSSDWQKSDYVAGAWILQAEDTDIVVAEGKRTKEEMQKALQGLADDNTRTMDFIK